MAQLKVYCTAIGFHDAYVAAPSQKAALAAWGSNADLFARKQAHIVDNPDLAAEVLARPGEVIKRVRGSTAEHLAALPPNPSITGTPPKKRKISALPRPSRDALDAAEAAVAATRSQFDARLAEIAKREEELIRERKRLQDERAAALTKLEDAVDRAASRFDASMAKWRAE